MNEKRSSCCANAVDAHDFAWAEEQVRRLGIDPETVPHDRTNFR